MAGDRWLTTLCDHTGQPLAIRLRPPDAVADATGKYSYLLAVTHHLRSVRADGMPDPDYNESLAAFDAALVDALDEAGRVVVVETCAGRRLYYAYVADEAAAKRAVTQVLAEYGCLSESGFRGGPDPAWQFYAAYLDGPAAGTTSG